MLNFRELKLACTREDLKTLPTLRAVLLCQSAPQFLAAALRGMAASRGYHLELWVGGLGIWEADTAPQGPVEQFNPEFVLCCPSTRKFALGHAACPAAQRNSFAVSQLDALKDILTAPSLAQARLMVCNLPELDDGVYGSLAASTEDSLLCQIRTFNTHLAQLCHDSDVLLCDWCALQSNLGRRLMSPDNLYATALQELSFEALPYAASRLVDLMLAVRGRIIKCVITDLDNTLWGGILGEDGFDGIRLGPDLALGSTFTEIQYFLKKLIARGIILCVASKNDESKVLEVFDQHPAMVLRREDVAVFKVGYGNKADSIMEIATLLNIGVDQMLFLDDSPFERNLVRSLVPGIVIPELPEDPACYLDCLRTENYFETTSVTAADAVRNEQYRIEATRALARQSCRSEEDYLRSLDMTAGIRKLDSFTVPRVAQLCQRTNQFNFRTVRYSAEELLRLTQEPDVQACSVSLKDKFGDLGIIGALILRKSAQDTLFIDTWILSCRAFRRGLPQLMVAQMIKLAHTLNCQYLLAEYLPTAKNALIADLCTKLGFSEEESTPPARHFRLDVQHSALPEHFIRVEQEPATAKDGE